MTDRSGETRQSLCLSCGLCCDGTIFRFVDIDDLDAIQRFKSAGIAFQLEKDAASEQWHFMQPCPAHDGACCTIYSARPLKCQEYECRLLRSYARGEIEFEAAAAIIETAKERRGEILKTLAELSAPFQPSNNFRDLFHKIVEFLKTVEDSDVRKKYNDVALKISAFGLFISANFKNLEDKKIAEGNEAGSERARGEPAKPDPN